MTVRVLVADDQAMVRVALAALLDAQPDLTVVGEAADGVQAVALAREVAPDVVLMDIRMPRLDGIAATRHILAQPSPPHVVALTTYDLDEYLYDVLRAGASGFLLKHAPPEELLLGVRAAADGGALLSPTVTKRLLGEFTRQPRRARPPAVLDQLTPREREIFDLIVRGRSNSEIAQELFVAESTVKTHVTHALTKLGLRDRVHAVLFAYEHGLAGPAPRRPT
ncbi:response regulator transcription factor [Streptomyces sp. NPDC048342]|uniref:response regulator transcription factor n=1 Tax=unclassified Streptomyces TaxID=2593676 RepID=UPI0034155242